MTAPVAQPPEDVSGSPAPVAVPSAVAAGRWRQLAARTGSAAIAAPLALLAVLYLPSLAFLLLCVGIAEWAAVEYLRLLGRHAPGAPLRALLFALPPAVGLVYLAFEPTLPLSGAALTITVGTTMTVGLGSLLLLSRTPVASIVPALGILAFGVLYLGVPIGALAALQTRDPLLVFWLFAVVWLGDSAAYLCGSAWGRHRMAPVVSPKKSWEGAAAGFAAGLAASAAWSIWELGAVFWEVLAVGAATAIAAQLGDLVESLLKRGVAVKDSGSALPGHGGVLDRMDALLFAAPVLLAGVFTLTNAGVLP